MAERNSAFVSHAGGVLTVGDTRLAVGALWTPASSAVLSKTGFRPGPGTSPGLVTATGTPDANVHVAAFQLILQTGRAPADGTYTCTLDAAKTINILSTPADATNPRNDLVIAQQSDEFYSDANNAFVVKQVVGTPSGSPADPAVTGSTDYVLLARVRVNANATTITSGNITDLRPGSLYTVAVGGILPVPSQAVRDALTGIYDGFAVYRQDRNSIEVYNGAAWQPDGPRGVIGGTQYTGTGNLAAGITNTETLFNMNTGAVALDANRRFRISAKYKATYGGTSAVPIMHIRDGSIFGAILAEYVDDVANVSAGHAKQFEAMYETGSAVTKTFVLAGQTAASNFTIVGGGTTNPTWITVEDIGPSGVVTIQNTP